MDWPLRGRKDVAGFDFLAAWVFLVNSMQAMLAAKALGIPVLIRASHGLGIAIVVDRHWGKGIVLRRCAD
jgi:hypothetical protein